MSILIKGLSLPKDGTYLDLVITEDGVVRCYGAEDEIAAEAVEFPDCAVVWGTKSDGIPVLMFIQPESKEGKDEHTD